MVTPKRVSVVIACVFVTLTLSSAPVFVVNTLGMKYFPGRNKTLIGNVHRGDREQVEKISFAINSFFLPVSAFIAIIVCTTILVISLHKSLEWRKLSSRTSQAGVYGRNQKVAKMVIMISVLFISCFLPMTVFMLAMAFVPAIAIGGTYVYIGIVAGAIGTLLESINSSSNIFIYYHMSSNYKEAFQIIFCKHKSAK